MNHSHHLVAIALILSTTVSTLAILNAQAEEDLKPEPSAPMVSARELTDFRNEMNNLRRETKQLLGQMTKAQGVDEWKRSVQEILAGADSCLKQISSAGTNSDEQRSVMDDCRGQGFWDTLNEVRSQFVPPQEINSALKELKRHLQELSRYKRAAEKLSNQGAIVEIINALESVITNHQNLIKNYSGQNQRDALQDFRSANIGEEVNKIRALIELPKEIKQILNELKYVERDFKARTMQKSLEFFRINPSILEKMIADKRAGINRISLLVEQGNGVDAQDVMQDEIHNGWHPGDLRHLLGILRNIYDKLRSVRDETVKTQINEVLEPILETLLAGEVREARDAMVQFEQELQQYEHLFRKSGPRSSGLDQKTRASLDRLEKMMREKYGRPESEPLPDTDNSENWKTTFTSPPSDFQSSTPLPPPLALPPEPASNQ